MTSARRTGKRYILDQEKINQVKKILHARSDAEAITRALDIIIENATIETMFRSIRGNGSIRDVYGSTTGISR